MKDIIKKIKQSKRVAIIAHISPDGDCLSSMTALSCILSNMGKQVKKFIDLTTISDLYKEFYNIGDDISDDLVSENFDTIITVDLPSIKMMGKYGPIFVNFKNTIAIDHHVVRDYKAKYEYIDTNSASCSEIILKFIEQIKVKITPQIATILLSGIITDSGCFQNDNTNAETLYNASKLISYGADSKNVIFKFQKQQKLQELKLKMLGYQNMVIKNQIGYNIFTLKQFKECECDNCGNFVNEILNIDDNIFAFVIKQKEKNVYTVSLRCKNGYNVAVIAKMFGGGGHVQAAGMSFVGAPVRHAKLIYNECIKQIKK